MTVTITFPEPADRLMSNEIARFQIDGEPRSKARPRLGKGGHVYTPAETVAAEQAVGWAFLSAARGFKPNATDTYGLRCEFYLGTRQRRDVDNMIKLICDGLNRVAWDDDSQVSELAGRKQYAEDKTHARTEIVVYRTGIVERPMMTCEHCGVQFPTYESWTGIRRFCGTKCRAASIVAKNKRECPQCGRSFQSAHGAIYCSKTCVAHAKSKELSCIVCGALYRAPQWAVARNIKQICSAECRTTYWREHRLVAARGVCCQCGGPTSRKTYQRCQACALAVGCST